MRLPCRSCPIITAWLARGRTATKPGTEYAPQHFEKVTEAALRKLMMAAAVLLGKRVKNRVKDTPYECGIARFRDADARAELESVGVTCIEANLAQGDFAGVPADVDYVLNLAVVKSNRWDIDLAANAEATGTRSW